MDSKLVAVVTELEKIKLAFTGDASGWEERKDENDKIYYFNINTEEKDDKEPEVLRISRIVVKANEAEKLANELDKIRSAFSGDSSGWRERVLPSGAIVYENQETEEKSVDEPEVLYIARITKEAEMYNQAIEELQKQKNETKELKFKIQQANVTINKLRTEINQYHLSEKAWKESSKIISKNLLSVKNTFDLQCEQVMSRLTKASRVTEKISKSIPFFKSAADKIEVLKERIIQSQTDMFSLHSNYFELERQLQEKEKHIETLSVGLQEEVERITNPIRERLSETTLTLMKEKAARVEERRELADLWPSGHLLPTLLLKYRSLSDDEKRRRIQVAETNNARLALSIEIRANVAESKRWIAKFDSYGRQYFEHELSGEVSWTEPDIMKYQPPTGYDDSGNMIFSSDYDTANDWHLVTSDRGEAYYQHAETGEISYNPPLPFGLQKRGKSDSEIVSEAAQLVLQYIKTKIRKHIDNQRRLKEVNENILTPEERSREQVEERNRQRLGFLSDGETNENNEGSNYQENIDEEDDKSLEEYVYDIETVEMLAWKPETSNLSLLKKAELIENKRTTERKFMHDLEVRNYRQDSYVGPTLYETDVTNLSLPQLRVIAEKFAIEEEALEFKLRKVRENLKDFSCVIVDRMKKVKEENETVSIEKNNEEIVDSNVYSRNDTDTAEVSPVITSSTSTELNTVNEDNVGFQIAMNDADKATNITTIKATDMDVSSVDYQRENFIRDNYILTDHCLFHEETLSDNLENLRLSSPAELWNICGSLVSFTLFCGYLNIDVNKQSNHLEVPKFECYDIVKDVMNSLESTKPITLQNKDEILQQNESLTESTDVSQDDEWLSASYYTTISKETVDIIKEMTSRVFDPSFGLAPATPLHSESFLRDGIFESLIHENNKDSFKYSSYKSDEEYSSSRVGDLFAGLDLTAVLGSKGAQAMSEVVLPKLSNPWISSVKVVNQKAISSHAIWKHRQLMAEVLRFQLQQEAIQWSLDKRLESTSDIPSKLTPFQLPSLESTDSISAGSYEISISKVTFRKSNVEELPWEAEIYAEASMIGWRARTLAVKPINQKGIIWSEDADNLSNFKLRVSRNLIESQELTIEFYLKRVMLAATLVGYSCFNISKSIQGENINQKVTLEGVAVDKYHRNTGTLIIEISAKYVDEMKHDSQEPSQNSDYLTSDEFQNVYPLLPHQKLSFASLVDDLRSEDGMLLSKLIVGDITAEDVLAKGYRINSHTTRPLPDFKKAYNYLSNKMYAQKKEINLLLEDITNKSTMIPDLINQKMLYADKIHDDLKYKYKLLKDELERIQLDVNRLKSRLLDLSLEISKPVDPEKYSNKQIRKFVHGIPNIANSAEGLTRFVLSEFEFNQLMDSITKGDMDGKDWSYIFEKSRLTSKQSRDLNLTIASRNALIEKIKQAEQDEKMQSMEKYRNDLIIWEKDNKKRAEDLERAKKDLRRANLKYQLTSFRLQLFSSTFYQSAEIDIKTFKELIQLHEKACETFKIFQFKIALEKNRQVKCLEVLKQRLLQALNDRRRAFEMPKAVLDSSKQSSFNNVSYLSICDRAEEILRTLRFEILDIKSNLHAEGQKLRNLHHEELSTYRHEYNRIITLQDTIHLRLNMDKLIERHTYEVMHLYESRDKLVLNLADKDNIGYDTIDEKGEEYSSDKVWSSKELEQCDRTIELVMQKIKMIETISKSASSIQKSSLDFMSMKWGYDYFQPMYQSNIMGTYQSSEYQRTQVLLGNIVKYLENHQLRLSNQESSILEMNEELKLQLSAYHEQFCSLIALQEYNSKAMNQSTSNVISTLREELVKLRVENKEKYHDLEEQNSKLLKECQEIREELSTQAIIQQSQTQMFQSTINTQQGIIRELSSKLNAAMQANDKSKLQYHLTCDALKNEIRQERKLSSTLFFIMHTLRSSHRYYQQLIEQVIVSAKSREINSKSEKSLLRKDIFDNVYTITRMSIDPNVLFEFFVSRLANLAGSRKIINDFLGQNHAAAMLGHLCRSPKPLIRKLAARALSGLSWNGYIEKKVLLLDATTYWKMFKKRIIKENMQEYTIAYELFCENGNYDSFANTILDDKLGDEDTSSNKSLSSESIDSIKYITPSNNNSSKDIRSIIKQKRQYALVASKRLEGPNTLNQQQINVKEGIIPSLLSLSLNESSDLEISRHAVLAVCVASKEPKNHYDFIHSDECMEALVRLLDTNDPEIQCHVSITIANLCHNDEQAQLIFHKLLVIPKLLQLLKKSIMYDIIEATSAALANLTCLNHENCLHVIESSDGSNGLEDIVKVLFNTHETNIKENYRKGEKRLTSDTHDKDQIESIQANLVELITNISRYATEVASTYFHNGILDVYVFLLHATNIRVRKFAPLAIGNAAQSERIRQELSSRGVIEALFQCIVSSLRDPIEGDIQEQEDLDSKADDEVIQVNCMWALNNLMWHPANQEKAGKYLDILVKFISSTSENLRIHTLTLLANVLYYSHSNRSLFLKVEGAIELLLDLVSPKEHHKFDLKPIVENSLRSLISLSYVDYVAEWLGNGGFIIYFLSFLQQPYFSRDSMRYSLSILANLCVHHENRRRILQLNGIEIIVSLHIDEDKMIRDLSQEVIDHLKDVTPIEVINQRKKNIGLYHMIPRLKDEDPLVRATASETICEEIWKNPEKQNEAIENHAIDGLLNLCSNVKEPIESLYPALWALKDLLHHNVSAQDQISRKNGISILCSVTARLVEGIYEEHTLKLLEVSLQCLVYAIHNHTSNSRRLLFVGLKLIIDLAEKNLLLDPQPDISSHIRVAIECKSVVHTSKGILRMLGPYNYVVCINCGQKQDLMGESCLACGNRLRVETSDKITLRARQKLYSSQDSLSKADKKDAKMQKQLLHSKSPFK